jgi:hypothetical protein
MDFTKTITVTPAYDCTAVQPCVHDSPLCGTDPDRSHGKHNAVMALSLRGPEAAVDLVVNTGWFLPQTATGRTHDVTRMGAVLGLHASAPWYDGQRGYTEACSYGWTRCYSDVSYIAAEEGALLLVTEGTDAVWAWLEAWWNGNFSR